MCKTPQMLSGLRASSGGLGTCGVSEEEVVMFGCSSAPRSSWMFEIMFLRSVTRFSSCRPCSRVRGIPSSELSAICSAITSSACCISSPAVL